jgi:hypothetical protein
VSIDERRAKFRADLVSHGVAAKKDSEKPVEEQMEKNPHPHHDWIHRSSRYKKQKKPDTKTVHRDWLTPGHREGIEIRGRHETDDTTRYRSHSRTHSHDSSTPSMDERAPQDKDGHVIDIGDGTSINWDDDLSSDGEEDDQDIQEIWFPGGHGDIGGGWDMKPNEVPLSHVPLVWIVHEAQRAGLQFDPEKMEIFDCLDGSSEMTAAANLPAIEVSTTGGEMKAEPRQVELGKREHFKAILEDTILGATLHDCLRFDGGLTWGATFRWTLMEYLPFRRLDLEDDGKWKPIRWCVFLPTLFAMAVLILGCQAASAGRSERYARRRTRAYFCNQENGSRSHLPSRESCYGRWR